MKTFTRFEQQHGLEPSNRDIFEILEQADTQYNDYVELTRYDFAESNQSIDSEIKRDINHPLSIVVR